MLGGPVNLKGDHTMINVIYARKPASRAEVESGTRPGAGVPRPTIVTEELALSAIEYDSFLSSPLGRRSWLKGRGGWDKNGVRRAIALKCPGRITLYVDPSGYDYGRYVGVKV
jgi:hypothetical protein